MPTVTRIDIYPLKSFDPILVRDAQILASGALEFDRQFAFVNPEGKFLNAKRTPLIHLVSVELNPVARTLTARPRSELTARHWHIDSDRSDVEAWFSEYFSMNLTLHENTRGGFPDDEEATGPTIISTASIEAVASWFPGLSVDQIRRRFRANIEVSDVEPFWEDCLFGSLPNTARPFRIGDVMLAGTNPCQRCVVPSRDQETGEVWPEFAKQFSNHREAQLPPWAPRGRFNHFYRLSVNTRLVGLGSGTIHVGDELEFATL